MNETNQPSQRPPAINIPAQLGEDPAERVPITGVISAIEAILRQPRRVLFQLREPGAGKVIGALVLIALVCSLVYGIILGSFSGGDQWWAAPIKACVGLLVSAVVCLPSLYIFASLGGSRARLTEIVGLVAGLLALLAVLLIGFAPVAWLFSQSTESVVWMGVLHLLFCLIAALFGVRFLKNGFFHSQAKSHAALNTWAIIFLLVLLQMSTALRPLLGTASTFLPQEKKFFLSHWIDNMNQTAE